MKKALIVTLIGILIFIFYCCSGIKEQSATLKYVGTEKCQTCHSKEFSLYQTSDHFHAMDTLSAETVKGDFNNTRFIYNDDTAFFYKEGRRYFVRTTDSTGVKKNFEISYTFGWRPLQQYLVKFDDGRIQVLPFCWDTRPLDKGGQRWYHLYGKERITHTDELFWMGINQNWNYMCADCHTTDYKKNFDESANRFNSNWTESKVSCESCHGPASGHLLWTDNKDANSEFKGFSVSLRTKMMNWYPDNSIRTLKPGQVVFNDTLIETCARCHARATRFTDDYQHGSSLLQSHVPSTADPVNYYIDGQIKEENYEYASFLQSKMYASGVTCIHCHEPHSMKVRSIGNSLCTSCHQPAKYDGPQHSFHQPGSTGNQCTSCHMPSTTYMGIDVRLDHSIRIPRPDHSLSMGTPNACNKCHTNRSVQWAADKFGDWFKNKLPPGETYAEQLQRIAAYVRESEPSLYRLLSNNSAPAIIRATAMEQYGYLTTTRVKEILDKEIASPVALIRLNALKALRHYPNEGISPRILSLLYDKVEAIRIEAMLQVAPYVTTLSSENEEQFTKIKMKYLQLQTQMSHRPEGYFNRALLYGTMGDNNSAKALYETCIQRFPDFVPAYGNLADIYRQAGDEAEAKRIIDTGLSEHPENGFLHYTLGLWYIRRNENAAGLGELRHAAQLDPANSQLVYTYAIGLFHTGQQAEALKLLIDFAKKYGNQSIILDGIISISSDLQLDEMRRNYTELRKEVYGY